MRAWFNGRSRREQLLVTLFVLLGAGIAFTSAARRLRAEVAAWRSARLEQTAQQLWLDRREEIERRAASAVSNLDPSRTYDATGLAATITRLASSAGLSPAVDPAVTQRTPQFAYHTARVTFRRASLPALLRFYDDLAREAPYLNLEQVAVLSDRAPGVVNVTAEISATQVIRP